MHRTLVAAAVLAFAASAFAQTAPPADNNAHGVVIANIDHNVKPGDNFFMYANGAWVNRTELPPDRTSIGAFSIVADKTDKQVAAIIQSAADAHGAPGSDEKLIADLYSSFMNTSAIEQAGLKPLQARLTEIANIKTPHELARALGQTLRADVDALNNTNFHTPNLFGVWVAPGFNDPDHYTAYLMQGGVLLPNSAFYTSATPHMTEIQTRYQAHLTAIFRLAGFDHPELRADRVYQLELAIAKTHTSLADNEDIHKANNPWPAAAFAKKAAGLDWAEYFRAAGLEHQREFIVWQPSAITAEAALVAATPVSTWQDFLRAHLIDAYAAVLPEAFADESFNFYGKVLRGAQAQRPRNLRGIAVVNGVLGDAVGKVYAQRYFSAADKARVQALVANLIATFHQRLEQNTWMAPATKKEAIAKLDTLQVGIGYPDHWRSYAGLEIRADDLLGNLMRASLFDYHYELGRIGQTVDRKEWCMEPQTVNAVNLPLDNGLNFPAAIMQPPFYDPQANDAFNYGAIGSVIGHEISHTFDSEGAAFDSRGRVRNWWTPEDLKHFEAVTAALAAQYDGYMPFPDLHLNGRQTLGENIADVAGVNDAYQAFHASLHGQEAPVVEGLSGDQQFFLAFGQNWISKAREASVRAQVATDPHSPAEFRADTVRNLDPWYPAFNVQPTDKLYLAPDQRIRIW